MEIRISLNSGPISQFSSALRSFPSRANTELKRGLNEGGDKLRTLVRRSLKQQVNLKSYGTVVSHTWTKGAGADLTYTIGASGKGLPIDLFPTRYSSSPRAAIRWSPKDHWKLQPRNSQGQFGPLADDTSAGVTSNVWNVAHPFKRSFVHPRKGAVAIRPGSRSIRALYGASLPKEITKDQSAATFETGVRSVVEPIIVKRLGRLMP